MRSKHNNRVYVTNEYGKELDYEVATILMDDDLREQLHMELAPCTEEGFFDAYVKAHKAKFGEDWGLAKPNPTW